MMLRAGEVLTLYYSKTLPMEEAMGLTYTELEGLLTMEAMDETWREGGYDSGGFLFYSIINLI
jgi:hypothetical protein